MHTFEFEIWPGPAFLGYQFVLDKIPRDGNLLLSLRPLLKTQTDEHHEVVWGHTRGEAGARGLG